MAAMYDGSALDRADDPNAAACRTCQDNYTVRFGGTFKACPTCCCKTCQRPMYLHPEQNGCVCKSKKP